MRQLFQWALDKAGDLIQASRTRYGVDPIVWFVISTIASPAFYYGAYRLVRAIVKRLPREIMIWGAVFGCAFIAPYVYVLLFGRNLPWWVYLIMAALVGQGVYSVVRKIRSRKAETTEGTRGEPPPG
jgi:hypothetical protein